MSTDDPGLFEIMYNCRAMRRLDTRPVPREDLVKLIAAANQAPSGSNAQSARWLVVVDDAQKARLAELNRKGVEAYVGPQSARPSALPHQAADKRARMLKSVQWQADHMHELPALVIAAMEFGEPVTSAHLGRGGGSIWPGIQNLLLAARALGLGATPTTLGLTDQAAVRSVLDMPDTMAAFCLIPVGYPLGKFGPVTRMPVETVMRFDRWS